VTAKEAAQSGAEAAQMSGGEAAVAGDQNLRQRQDAWPTDPIRLLDPNAADAIAVPGDARQGPAPDWNSHAAQIWETGLYDHPRAALSLHPRRLCFHHLRDRPYGNPAPFCSALFRAF
tara:strand:+ start:12967 stop:13320 length:354 start_codon:yes stop_codon:yes gene_type:complete